MVRYFFDFKSDGVRSADEEGVELLNIEAAHETAVVALADALRDGAMEGATSQQMSVEVRYELGLVVEVSVFFRSRIIRKQ